VLLKLITHNNNEATRVNVLATFYDATGQIVDYETVSTSPPDISPGETADFIVDAVVGVWGDEAATARSITSVNVTAHSDEYLSLR
jgi:hypothetical protein